MSNAAWRRSVGGAAATLLAGAALCGMSAPAFAAADGASDTTTPIKHVVVIFDENISFDHYFGTYPKAANTDGTTFTGAADTPSANTLVSAGLLAANPNQYTPKRLSQAEAVTCDQNHAYPAEQRAEDDGKMDLFVQNTSSDTCTGEYGSPGLAMDYYDGNTVTALWNYAQNYAMSDNNWDSIFGQSTPGAIDLVSGQTHGAVATDPTTGDVLPTSSVIQSPNADGVGSLISDPDPAYDDCSNNDHTSTSAVAHMQGKNIGDLLNAKNVTWGWFQGGFAPSTKWDGKDGDYARCDSTTANTVGTASKDYSPHHNPFSYYKSTSNPHHLAPTSEAMIGHTDRANHNYDLTDFASALKHDNLPAVSFLKAPEAQDAHAGYSDPLDEQKFLVEQINAIQESSSWSSTAIVVTYDDSDGWYDHVAPTIVNGSNDSKNDSSICTAKASSIAGGYQDRCGPSQRLPLLVISPFSKQNAIDHAAIEQTSVLRFIEDNWSTGRIGDDSFDERAGDLTGMFDFAHPQQRAVLLAADGSVSAVVPMSISASGHGDGNSPGDGTDPGGGSTTGGGHGGSSPSTGGSSATGSSVSALAATGLSIGSLVVLAALLVGGGLVLRARKRKKDGSEA
ncbi:phospholipase C [Humibacter ginsenosidimutans]|uniref:phospholipase C n=1 Tax=Humibacter ginsenosidimutans TaxID=2599293 RepID=A0A5B8M4Y1_9MICO|nr:alkaline phosphatase family protein [Humibacter ginsenosidimutans]QDZ15647.1 alkaline phosphatase family protein [Humibacter ginsenosidimutans]